MTEPIEAPIPATRSRLPVILALGAAAVLLILVLVSLTGGGGDDEESATTTTQPTETTTTTTAAGSGGAAPTETFEVFATKNPFLPLRTTGTGTAGATGTSGTTGGATTGTGTSTGTSGGTGTTGTSTGTGGTGTVEPRRSDRVALLDVFVEDGEVVANVRVNDTVHKVGEGDTFATSYTVLSLSQADGCGRFMFGDDTFRLCEGEETLK